MLTFGGGEAARSVQMLTGKQACPQIERQAAISAGVAIGKISSEIRFKLKLQDCMTDPILDPPAFGIARVPSQCLTSAKHGSI